MRPHSAATTNARTENEIEHNYRNLLLNGAWLGIVDGGIFNFLPVFLARLGAPAAIVGLVTSGPALAGILSYIPGGAYAERQNNLVRLVVWSSFVVRISALLIAVLPFFVPPEYIAVVAVILWTLLSMPNGVQIPAWTTVMQQAVPAERRAHLNGTRWSLYSLVSAISIAGFGFMLDRVSFPAGYQVVFLISFVAASIGLYYFSKIRVPPFEARSTGSPPRRRGTSHLGAFFRPLVDSPAFVRYNIASLPWRTAYNLPIALFSLYWVNELHASDTWIGLRGTVAYAALVVGYRMWGQLTSRLGHRTLLLICGSLACLYPLLTALAPGAPWLLPAAVIWGLALSGADIGLFDMLLATCPPGRQPSFAATSNMLVSVATFFAPLLGGLLSQAIGIRGALFVAAGLQLATTVFFLLLPNRDQENHTVLE